MNIQLRDYLSKPKANVGYVINENWDAISKLKSRISSSSGDGDNNNNNNDNNEDDEDDISISLRICNSVLWGTFTVPYAIGFSTPLDALGPLSDSDMLLIQKERSKKGHSCLKRYHEWKGIFGTVVYRRPAVQKIVCSSDLLECGLCLDEYKVGEELIEVECKHRFHFKCYMKMKSRDPCPYCRKTAVLPSLSGMTDKEKIMQIFTEKGY